VHVTKIPSHSKKNDDSITCWPKNANSDIVTQFRSREEITLTKINIKRKTLKFTALVTHAPDLALALTRLLERPVPNVASFPIRELLHLLRELQRGLPCDSSGI
jgi:hypothetical protein